MDKLNLMIDARNYNPGGKRFQRTAARGIIKQGDFYGMIYSSKYGEYKFPGGGLEEGEAPGDALIREVREETGLLVITASIEYIGKAEEVRKGRIDDILEMTSYYFTCKVEAETTERNLDEYEKEYDYNLRYVTLREAIENNEEIANVKEIPWITRDTEVMRELVKWEKGAS